jgi:hypothetical protein
VHAGPKDYFVVVVVVVVPYYGTKKIHITEQTKKSIVRNKKVFQSDAWKIE